MQRRAYACYPFPGFCLADQAARVRPSGDTDQTAQIPRQKSRLEDFIFMLPGISNASAKILAGIRQPAALYKIDGFPRMSLHVEPVALRDGVLVIPDGPPFREDLQAFIPSVMAIELLK